MADERVTPVSYQTPTIKQINVAGTNYWIKDADARTYITNLEAAINNLGTAADKDFTTTIAAGNTDLPTSDAVFKAIQAVPHFDVVVVTTLPSASEETMYKIYMINQGEGEGPESGTYTEYITVNDGGHYNWEKIGTTHTDLSEYAKWGTYTGTASVEYQKSASSTANYGPETINVNAEGEGSSKLIFTGTNGSATANLTDYATGVTTTAAGTDSVNDVTAAALNEAPAFTGKANQFTDDCVINIGDGAEESDRNVVTSISTTAAATTSVSYVTGVSFSKAPEFTGTTATITSTGNLAAHTHLFDIGDAFITQTVLESASHKAASWTASVASEVLSFSWEADTFTPTSRTVKVFDESAESLETSDGGAATLSVSATYQPAGSISYTLSAPVATQTVVTSAINQVIPSYQAFAHKHKFLAQGTVSKPDITLTKSTKTFVTSAIASATLETGNKTINSSYTPAGTISGSVVVPAHNHDITLTTATATGAATVTLTASAS